MSKSATQRMSMAQIRAAHRDATPVAVDTGFKRGFSMDAYEATIIGIGQPRTVFRGSSDMLGREVHDGVMIQAAGADRTVVAPSDILSTWEDYTVELDSLLKAREDARTRETEIHSKMVRVAARLGGSAVVYDDVQGVFLPHGEAMDVFASVSRDD